MDIIFLREIKKFVKLASILGATVSVSLERHSLPHPPVAKSITLRLVPTMHQNRLALPPCNSLWSIEECHSLNSRPTLPWVKIPYSMRKSLFVFPSTDSYHITLLVFSQSVGSYINGYALLIGSPHFEFTIHFNEFLTVRTGKKILSFTLTQPSS